MKKSGALSSVGSEHLVYTERVGGSNPSGPTILENPAEMRDFFYLNPFNLLNFVYYFLNVKLIKTGIISPEAFFITKGGTWAAS